MAEAPGRHGLSEPLRTAVYAFFDRWLFGRTDAAPAAEFAVTPRPDAELLVCHDGQVNLSMRSRPFLPMAWEHFERKPKPSRVPLIDLLRLDPDHADPRIDEVAPARQPGQTVIVCINGNESRDWREEAEFLRATRQPGHAVLVVDPRGVGTSRPSIFAKAPHYVDPLSGAEENIAYNAFLVGRSVLGMRVADVMAAVAQLKKKDRPGRIVLCARRDAAMVACLAAAVDPAIDRVACEDMLLTFRPLFNAEGHPLNAASILPGLLQKFGDIGEIMAQVAPRKVLVASGIGEMPKPAQHIRSIPHRFSAEPQRLMEWFDASS
jgi:pimeloyl-ACP methyl ester carboxylesterase